MKKSWNIAKANIKKYKIAVVTLFAAVMITSALATVGLSLLLGVINDFTASNDRLHSLHSLFVMTKEQYLASYEDIIRNDPRISEYEIKEVLFADNMKVNYGGEIDVGVLILNIDEPMAISAPKIINHNKHGAYGSMSNSGVNLTQNTNASQISDLSVGQNPIPRENAVYLPVYTESLGYKTGDPFTLQYRNRLFELTVAGFFESNECSVPNGLMLKFFVPAECYEWIARYTGRSVWVAARCHNPADSTQFITDFADSIDIELSFFNAGNSSYALNWAMIFETAILPIMIISSIILIFTLLIILITLMLTRFRVTNSIEGAMHEIGVLKASGYTSRQITASYLMEYGTIAPFAALIGVFLPAPAFIFIRGILTYMTGVTWTLGVNPVAGLLSVIIITGVLLAMAAHSCRRIKHIQPVVALRGDIAVNSFRRNFFPLDRGAGNIQTRLGLKGMFAYSRFYMMVFAVIAGLSLALTFVVALYQNMVIDDTTFIKITGIEFSDVKLTVTRHTDADALDAELMELPEVRHTSMLDWIAFKVDDVEVMGFISNDFGKMEIMSTHDGRLPRYDNEVVITKILADQLGKKIGDSVKIKTGGVSSDFIVTGFFSTISNSGKVCHIMLDGFRKLSPNYRRTSINVYLSEGVSIESFTELLKQNYGVINMLMQDKSENEDHDQVGYENEDHAQDGYENVDYAQDKNENEDHAQNGYENVDYAQGGNENKDHAQAGNGNGRFAAAKARAEEKISYYIQYYNIDSVEYAVIYNGEIILKGSSGAYQIERIENLQELLLTQVATYSSAFGNVSQMVALVSLIIISLILTMTVRQIITKRRRELGIMKAGGFTTRQLARQLSASFLPCACAGILVGCAAGAALVNPAFTAMLSFSGVYNANMYASPVATIVMGILLLIFTFAAAYISAMKIRNISVYELISE